jgi:protein-tyrosine kinase
MSRIEEALRRAQGLDQPVADGGDPVSVGAAQDAHDLLDSPWRFDAPPVRPHARDTQPASMVPQRPLPRPVPEETILPDPTRVGSPLFDGGGDAVGARFVGTRDIPPVSVEQYRRLAATLHHMQLERGTKVVMITSALSGEGKSLTSTNLALTLSQSYRRHVLLIDGDLRRPSIHHIFKVQNASGLSEGLKATDERKLSIIEVFEHLAILTAGKPDPDPMSGLTSERMRRIVGEAASKFDWVIIDTPPVGLLPDAGLMAAMADAAVLVVGAAQTPFDVVQRSVDSIGREKLIGVVLNRTDETGPRRGGQYQSYYEDSSYARPR